MWRAGFVLACLVHLYGLYSPRQAAPDPGVPYADKVTHLLLFAVVAYTGLRVGVPARLLLPLLVVNAVVSELVQHFLLPHRSGDPFDSVADLAGVALGAWAGFRARRLPDTR
ncbi:MAG TPA: VanZ family protein [Kribbella sp.]|nr:VanZ family protein [Kribbella sp.]